MWKSTIYLVAGAEFEILEQGESPAKTTFFFKLKPFFFQAFFDRAAWRFQAASLRTFCRFRRPCWRWPWRATARRTPSHRWTCRTGPSRKQTLKMAFLNRFDGLRSAKHQWPRRKNQCTWSADRRYYWNTTNALKHFYTDFDSPTRPWCPWKHYKHTIRYNGLKLYAFVEISIVEPKWPGIKIKMYPSDHTDQLNENVYGFCLCNRTHVYLLSHAVPAKNLLHMQLPDFSSQTPLPLQVSLPLAPGQTLTGKDQLLWHSKRKQKAYLEIN